MHPLLAHHRALLDRWRHTMNLVGPGSLDAHYEDCQRALQGLPLSGRWADLGSGAGFPGIVLAARFPELDLTLVDSRRKRCAFLERVLATAPDPPPRVRVRCERVEQLPGAHFDGVTGRAFAPPVQLLDHARRLLVPGGQVLFFLQEDAALDIGEDFEDVHAHSYAFGEGQRRVRLLRYEPGRG